MYLLERLLGVFTYTAVLLVVCFLIMKMQKKNIGKILLFYTFALSIMGFLYVPASGADLYRLIPIMHIYSESSFEAILQSFFDTSTPMAMIYYWLIGQFNIDGLLPAITAFITYSNIFYIFKDYIKRNEDIDKKNIALTLFFIMATGFFIETISNIRTILAFSIIVRCIYNEMFNKKSIIWNIPLYIIASLIHASSLAITIIRIGFFVFFEKREEKNILIKKIVVILVLIGTYLGFGDTFVNLMIEKATNYFTDGDYFWIWDCIKTCILILEIVIFNIYYKKFLKRQKENDSTSMNNLVNFSILMNVIILAINLQEFNTFFRFTYFNTMLNIPILLNILKDREEKKSDKKLQFVIFILSMASLGIAVTRGTLSSLKFF